MHARDMTKLQKLVAHTSSVEAIIAHLQKAAQKYGVESFDLLLEMNVAGKEHIPVVKLGLENAEFDFSDGSAKKIQEHFHESFNSKEPTTAIAEVADVFNHDARFNQIIADYQTKTGQSGDKLRDYLLAEIACCILEACTSRRHAQLFSKWQELEKEYKDIIKSTKSSKVGLSKKHQRSVALKMEQQKVKQEIETGAVLLRNLRRIAATYKHQVAQPKKRRVSLITKKLDPMHMDEANRELLASLIKSNPDVVFFDAVDPQTGKPKLYLVPDPIKSGVFHHVKLTQSLVGYTRKKSNEKRYAVCHSTPLGQGGYGVVYESTASIALKNGINGKPAHAVVKKKSEDKYRVVKHLHDAAGAVREADMMEKIMLMHSKKAVVEKDESRASLVMRKFKGKELIDHLIADWGESHEVINKNTFTVDQRIALTIMVGEAIRAAHEKGIIHRDIKGDNVIVELDKDNNPLSAVVIDYGLAKYKGEKTTEHVGTSTPIDYRAPEVVLATDPWSDEKSDAYSFATLMNEIIWADVILGRRYKELSSNQKIKISEIMQRGMKPDPAQRASMDEIIGVFKSVQLQRQHDQVRVATQGYGGEAN